MHPFIFRWFYVTWIVYILPFVSGITTATFLGFSGVLWYNFLRCWKGDPGLVNSNIDIQMKTIVQLAEKGAEKGRLLESSCLKIEMASLNQCLGPT